MCCLKKYTDIYEVFKVLATVSNLIKTAKDQSKKLYFNLTVYEMAIRKQIQWNKNSRKFEGYVNLGRGDIDGNDDTPEATNTIVFILHANIKMPTLLSILRLLCYKISYETSKIPVAFYFINALSGVEILTKCCAYGIDVRNITFDGAFSNIRMVENL
ncbi:hypothetical protein TSAR_015283, partial [Trichomalopsis sarcophagae]